MRRLNATDGKLALLDISKTLEPPALTIKDAPTYARFLDDVCALLAAAAHHLGAERLEQVRQAVLAAYKLGYLHGEVVDLVPPGNGAEHGPMIDLSMQVPPDRPPAA
jgi:hypothetical protein